MKMRRTMLPVMLTLFMCGVSVNETHSAGQVVTQETREWAKKTVENERSVAVAPARNSLVILYFLNRTGRVELDSLQKGMTLMLLTDLSQVPNLQLVERIKLQALAEELGLGSSGLVDQTTAPRVGKLVGARFISGGDFVGGKEARFDTQTRLLDVSSTEIAGQYTLPGTLDEILTTEKELAFKIVDTLKIRLKPEEEAAIRKPCSTSMKALDSLFRGVDASDRGEFQLAGDLYSQALKIDPDICVAAAALQELIGIGGYSESMKGKGGKSAKGDLFAPQSALADAASSVSSQTSLTNQVVHEDVLPKSAVAATTPVRIKVTFP